MTKISKTKKILGSIRNASDHLTSIVKLGEALGKLFTFLVVIVVGLGLTKVGSKIIDIPPLPLWVVGIVVILSSYPVAKFIEWLITRRKIQPPIEYGGLLWIDEDEKLIPVCPQCHCDVIYNENSTQVEVPRRGSLFRTSTENQYSYIYECPNHGKLEVVNDALYSLRQQVESIRNQRRRKMLKPIDSQ